MLRVLLVVLLLANGLFFAWVQGWLEPVSARPSNGDSEPRRVAAQVRPEAVRVLPPVAASQALGRARETTAGCMEGGPFTEAGLSAAETALLGAGMTVGQWIRESRAAVAAESVWIVATGALPVTAVRNARAAELRRLEIDFEATTAPAELMPGWTLSRHGSRTAADRALARVDNTLAASPTDNALVLRRELRVLALAGSVPAGATQWWLRVARADNPLQERLLTLPGPEVGGPGPFRPCAAR